MFRTESIKAEVEEMKKHNELLSEVAMELNSRGKRIEESEKEVKKLQDSRKWIIRYRRIYIVFNRLIEENEE